EILKLRSTTLPKDDWRVGDARWALDNIDRLARLSDRDRHRIREADQLNQRVEELHAHGKYSEAMGPARQALTIREAVLGGPHPDLAQSLNNLAAVFDAQGDDRVAQGYYQRALEIYQALYPKERYPQGHPVLATSLNNVGMLLKEQGNLGAARG